MGRGAAWTELDDPILELHQRQFGALDDEGLRGLIELLGLVRQSA